MNKKTKILLIDDDQDIRETLAMALEEEGFCVDKAENGEEAIAKTNQNFYNVAIVDWRLPDIAGTDLLDKLKDTTPRMVKIMLTGYPSMNNAMAAVNKHADAFLLKPVDFDVLFAKINELLKRQEEAKALSVDLMVNYIETRAKELKNEKITASSQ
jgi:DNA-binding NtrC family response regulator